MGSPVPLALLIAIFVAGVACNEKAERMKELLGEDAIQIRTTQDSMIDLSNHWLDQAFSALFATVANEKISSVAHLETKFHEKCVKRVKSVNDHAKCVSELLDVARSEKNRRVATSRMVDEMRATTPATWIGAFRIRRKRETRPRIVNREGYSLKSSNDASPFTMIAKQITKGVRAMKNKNEDRSWRQIMVDVKKEGEIIEQRKRVKEMLSKSVNSRSSSKSRKLMYSPRNADQIFDPRHPLANSVIDEDDEGSGGDYTIEMRNEPIEGGIDAEKMLQRLQEHPEDVLNDQKMPKMLNMSGQEKESMMRIKMIRDAVKLGLALGGQNVSDFDRKSVRFASPRFFAISPEEHKKDNDTINVLSPSLFSLHDEGDESERRMSLSTLLADTIRSDGGEKDAWMDLLTEVTGVADSVDDAARRVAAQSEGVVMSGDGREINVSRENVTNIYGEESYRKMKALEKLHGMYTPEQLEHFNKTGYSIMTDKQREIIYGKGAPFENQNTLKSGQNLTMEQARRALHLMVREMGNGNIKVGKYEKRMKDIVASPLLFTSIVLQPELASQALILSPVLFTSLILSPAVFGSVILSPWLFVPVILAPRALSPIIVSPAIFSPIILSPLVLDALVLVPGVANPFVLSPFCLCPFILSPQVMTPLILSPFALSPFILTPTALSPLILSPFVLSPSILSPSFVTAVVLSPYALSPSVMSPPTMISVFASPSILS